MTHPPLFTSRDVCLHNQLAIFTMEVFYELCADFLEKLNSCDENEDKEKLISSYIDQVTSKVKAVNDFRPGVEWFNVSSPLSLRRELAGKLVLLDFFTYCCINCLHVLPELKSLERKYAVSDGLVVVGVHSAKFDAEKGSERVSAAILRHDITHPVVNDVGCLMWEELEIACWPTLLLLGPGGHPLFFLMGEGHYKTLDLLVSASLSYFSKKGQLSAGPILEIKPSHHVEAASPLKFPGRVAVCGERLAIADSGHHRVLVVHATSGAVLHVAGEGQSGLEDGSLLEAQFNSPQGLVWLDENTLFVADTENHAIRKVDLERGEVTTVAGTGEMGTDRVGGQLEATKQPLSSPWGLALDPSRQLLLIAMAGTHQIWGLPLQDFIGWKGRQLTAGSCMALAGSGREENRNSAYPMAAGFAQPSGLALAGERLLVADSESSSVRQVGLQDGKVTAVVGGDKNPLNLFAYGSCDGRGVEARLQHPLDLAWNEKRQQLFVADTFNNILRTVDLATTTCETLTLPEDVTLCEPGGMCVDESRDLLIVADTNHHSIKLVKLAGGCHTTELHIHFPSSVDCGAPRGDSTQLRARLGEGEATLTLLLQVQLPEDSKPAPQAPQTWRLGPLPRSLRAASTEGTLTTTDSSSSSLCAELEVCATADSAPSSLSLQASVVSCSEGQCRMHRVAASVTIEREAGGPNSATLTLPLIVQG